MVRIGFNAENSTAIEQYFKEKGLTLLIIKQQSNRTLLV